MINAPLHRIAGLLPGVDLINVTVIFGTVFSPRDISVDRVIIYLVPTFPLFVHRFTGLWGSLFLKDVALKTTPFAIPVSLSTTNINLSTLST